MYQENTENYGKLNGGIGPKVVVIGGGTGLSVVLRGIKRFTENVTAIVTVADDGGGSGIIREELNVLPPGDIRNCILAMSDNEGVMEELLKFRFSDGRLSGQSMGNLIIAALCEIFGNFETAVEKMHDILKIKGMVVPVTGCDVALCAELKNGEIIRGESKIPNAVIEKSSPIKRVFLEPSYPEPVGRAIKAISAADIILMGPGSLYSSIIPNLLVGGISNSIQVSNAIKIVVCNVMTQRGETDDYTVTDYVDSIEEYLGKGILEFVMVNNKILHADQLLPYFSEGTRQMLMTNEDINNMEVKGITVIENNFINVKNGLIRHDAERLTNVLIGLMRY